MCPTSSGTKINLLPLLQLIIIIDSQSTNWYFSRSRWYWTCNCEFFWLGYRGRPGRVISPMHHSKINVRNYQPCLSIKPANPQLVQVKVISDHTQYLLMFILGSLCKYCSLHWVWNGKHQPYNCMVGLGMWTTLTISNSINHLPGILSIPSPPWSWRVPMTYKAATLPITMGSVAWGMVLQVVKWHLERSFKYKVNHTGVSTNAVRMRDIRLSPL